MVELASDISISLQIYRSRSTSSLGRDGCCRVGLASSLPGGFLSMSGDPASFFAIAAALACTHTHTTLISEPYPRLTTPE